MNKKILFIVLIISLICLAGVWATPKWQYVSIKNALHKPYELDVYDCDDFSKQLVTDLKAEGYDAGWVMSKDAKDGFCNNLKGLYEKVKGREMFCHAWVVIKQESGIIPIEATTGLPMAIETHNIFAYGTADGNNEWLYSKTR